MILKVRGVEVGNKNRSKKYQKNMLTCEGILGSTFHRFSGHFWAPLGAFGADVGSFGADVGSFGADVGSLGADVGNFGADEGNFENFRPRGGGGLRPPP